MTHSRFKGKPVANTDELPDACRKAENWDYAGLNRRGGIDGMQGTAGRLQATAA